MLEVSKEAFYCLTDWLGLSDALPEWMHKTDETDFFITWKKEITLPYFSSSFYSSNLCSVLAGEAETKIDAEPIFNAYSGVVRVSFKTLYTVVWHQDDLCKYHPHTVVLYVGE